VLIGGVVGDVIDDDSQATAVRFGDEPLECLQIAEATVDRRVVGDVVSTVDPHNPRKPITRGDVPDHDR
jgi:hypothetical protein